MEHTLAAFERLLARLPDDHPCWHYQPDPDWPSPCEAAGRWQPVPRKQAGDFSNVEQALELTLHDDIKHYFGHYFIDNLSVHHCRGPVQLLGAWNDQDFARLQENIIGHVLMKRRLQQPITVFIACTDDDSLLISVDNTTGQVVLEPVGQPAREVLADNLAAFLDSLTESPS